MPSTTLDFDQHIDLSVVVPVYRGAPFLHELHRRLVASLTPLVARFEIVLVEDGGPDESWSIIEDLARQDPRVRGVALSRNFGQHHAITAGLRHARGQWIVVMDGDLQDPPEEIANLWAKAQQGHDCVLARRVRRDDASSKRLSSWLFYRVFNYLADLNYRYDGTVANFSLISRRVADAINGMGEAVRFYGGFLMWMGFSKAYVDVRHVRRRGGESGYTFFKLMKLATNIILAHSNKPLRLCVYAGLLLSTLAFVGAVVHVVRVVVHGSPVMGWTSLIVSVWFGTGAIILALGIIGLYVDRIFTEVKHRPLYIVRKTTFDE
ncbi:MAG TPA: glycosyltransferase family 2 protein [Polyangia bacterium]|jgi:Glycosyltransferases involved in cell wall biogenesis|nr:glycosyltransferase family 2 protein [Polyangia bacterium]